MLKDGCNWVDIVKSLGPTSVKVERTPLSAPLCIVFAFVSFDLVPQSTDCKVQTVVENTDPPIQEPRKHTLGSKATALDASGNNTL